MKRWLMLLVAVVTVSVAGAVFAANSTITCATVSTVATLATPNSGRAAYSIWTTSGAATVYFKMGAGATVGGTDSGPIVGGGSYTEDTSPAGVYRGTISAVAKTGSVWVCIKESTGP